MCGWRQGVTGWLALVAVSLPAAALCGCGVRGMRPVSGTVQFDGQPLRTGGVTFYPDENAGNTSQDMPVGEIDEGRYELFTNGKRGAPPGAYKVVVTAFATPPKKDGGTAEMPKSLLPSKYGDRRTTPLSVEVAAEPPAGAYDLGLHK